MAGWLSLLVTGALALQAPTLALRTSTRPGATRGVRRARVVLKSAPQQALPPPRLPDSESRDKFLCAAVIGSSTGLAVAGLKLSTAAIQTYAYSGYLESAFRAMPDQVSANPVASALVVAAIPVFGGLAVAALKGLMSATAHESVCAMSLAELTSPGAPRMSVAAQIISALSAAATLGSGCSLGPEGPCVQLGASISKLAVDTGPSFVVSPRCRRLARTRPTPPFPAAFMSGQVPRAVLSLRGIFRSRR